MQSSGDLLLEAQPGQYLQVVVSSSNASVLWLDQNQAQVSLEFPAETGKATFSITPQEQGLYSLSYSPRTSSPFVKPEGSLLLVLSDDVSEHSTDNYFNSLHLAAGELAMGCCEYDYPLPVSVCPTDLKFKSSCTWTTSVALDGVASTGGVVFVTSRGVKLPLSIAGVRLPSSNSHSNGIVGVEANGRLQSCNSQCQSSDQTSAEICSVADQSIHFDENDLQDMLMHNSLASTFITEITPFLPSWLLIQILSGLNDNKYSSYDFKAYLGSHQDLQHLKGCDSIIPPSATAVYAMRTDTGLQITIDHSSFPVISSAMAPICFVVEICNSLKPRLIAPFPPELAKINYIEKLTVKGWKVEPTTVTFAEYGISKSAKFPDRNFWDGHEYLQISLPTYDFEMGVSFKGSLTGGELSVDVTFLGNLLYQGSPIGNEVRHMVCTVY